MVRLGILGIPDDFRTCYRPALERLAGQTSVAAVFDHVGSKAKRVADDFDAHPVTGVLAVADRIDVDGLLLLESGWHRDALFPEIAHRQKPVYLADACGWPTATLDEVRAVASVDGVDWMPSLPLRYQPVTMRLKELVATELGGVLEIRVESTAIFRPDSPEIAELVDWCGFAASAVPKAVRASQSCSTLEVDLTLSRSAQTAATVACRIHFTPRLPGSPDARPLAVEVFCENGRVRFESNNELVWQTDVKHESETLTSDRGAHEVMLDHFCRRIVGGLVPIPGLNDVCRSQETVRAIHTSLRETREVQVA